MKWSNPILGENKMSIEETKKQAKKLNTMWVCPNCGKTLHIKRRYCNCHASLDRAKVRISEELPEIGPCNFESSGLNCNDCPENCMWCASFGFPETDNQGFGGKDCRNNKGTTRCFCCQAQVKLALKIAAVDFSELLREALTKKESGAENVFYKTADFINSEMCKPVLARIQQAREKAG
jgi:hypothetical protein